MHHPQSPRPFEPSEQLAAALREQGVAPDELSGLMPTVRRLAEWQVPPASPIETQRLLARLTREMPAPSPVRQAIRARQHRPGASLVQLLATARTQVSLFGVAFWLVSALVTLLGAVAVLNSSPAGQEILLRASGPLLAFLGTVIAFRGFKERVLEFELVCLPSPVQLALARLVIVLGYDLGLGLALCLVLWAAGTSHVLILLLSWFMPLLLVAGLALLLTLRLPIQSAAALAYGSWLTVLAINTISTPQAFPLLPLTPLSDALLGGLGLALLVVALLRLQPDMSRLLPRT